MNIKTRLNQLEELVALKNGDRSLKVIVRADDETEEQAIQRYQLGNRPSGSIVVISEIDVRI